MLHCPASGTQGGQGCLAFVLYLPPKKSPASGRKALTTDAELWQVAFDAWKVTGKEVGRRADDSFGTAL